MATLFSLSSVKMLTLPLAIAAVTVFSGCATTTSPEARSAYDKTQQNLKSQPVSVISDSCIVRIEVGKNDIMYQQSDLTSLAMAQTVKTRLMNEGVKVGNTSSPFICGGLSKVALAKLDIRMVDKAKDVPNTAYPVLGSTNTLDSMTNQAYLNLFTALNAHKADAFQAKGAHVALGLDDNSLKTIRQTEGVNKSFVSTVAGSKPSFGAAMTVGAATVIASGGAYASQMKEGQSYAIYLVNLETNQIEWAKSGVVEGNVFKMPVSTSLETKKMFDPLYTN